MLITLTIVIVLASGLGLLNLLLIITWCLIKQRRKDSKVAEDATLGALEKRLSPIKRTRPTPFSRLQKRRKEKVTPSTPVTPTRPLLRPILLGESRTSNSTDNTILEHPSPPSRPVKSSQNQLAVSQTKVPLSRQLSMATRTDDTSSIYSAESAPIHMHERLFQPLTFENTGPVSTNVITRSSLPRGMDLPTSISKDMGLFLSRPALQYPSPTTHASLPMQGVAPVKPLEIVKKRATLDVTSDHFSNRDTSVLKPHVASRLPLLYRKITPVALYRSLSSRSSSSFPPPLW